MAKKEINVGTDGNDATGDPIREAFKKVNSNFDELYSVFKNDGGFSFTDLADYNTALVPDTTFIVNNGGTAILAKKLVSKDESISIDLDSDVNTINLTTTGGKLQYDTTPKLGGALNANNQTIFNLYDPTLSDVGGLGLTMTDPSLNKVAISRGYANANFVNITGDTMTGPLDAFGSAEGTQIPQIQEVVSLGGPKSNRTMTAPLFLSDHPGDIAGLGAPNGDDDLQAATKLYVDTTAFASQINLYVSTNGNDFRYEVPEEKRGTAFAYAFKTINQAAFKAGQFVDAQPNELGPYQKPIFYNNSANISYAVSMTRISSLPITANTTYNLEIRNAGGYGTDMRGKSNNPSSTDIRPGLLIRGTTSGATVVIDIVGSVGANSEFFTVRYIKFNDDGTPVTFITGGGSSPSDLAGEPLEYGEAVKSPNVTIYLESGEYFENLPIRLPNNVSLVGDDLRRVIIRPRSGPSCSTWSNVKFRRDLTIDKMNILTLTKAGNFVVGHKYIIASLGTTTNWTTIGGAGTYAVGTVFTAIAAGSGDGTANFYEIYGYHYLTDPTKSLYSGTITSPGGKIYAQKILHANRAFIQDEMIAYIDYKYSLNCIQTIGSTTDKIVVANVTNLYVNMPVKFSATTVTTVTHVDDGTGTVTLASVNGLSNGEIIRFSGNQFGGLLYGTDYYITNINTGTNKVTLSLSLGGPYVRGLTLASGTMVATITHSALLGGSNIVEGTTYYIKSIDNSGATKTITVSTTIGGSNVDLTDTTGSMTLKWVYDSVLCKRDVGSIVDALGFDLIYGGYSKSMEAAMSFFMNPSALKVVNEQVAKTLDSITHLTSLIESIIAKTPISVFYSNTTKTQRTTFTYSAEPANPALGIPSVNTIVDSLTAFMSAILGQDSSINFPKNNDDMDVLLLNDSNRVRTLSGQGHGGFMCVLDPTGQILTKSPYIQQCSSFSRSIGKQHFAGGVYVDAFTGNLPATITSRSYDAGTKVTTLTVSGLYRKPQTPTAFVISGVRFQVDYVDYDSATGNGTLHINPTTYDNSAYTRFVKITLSGNVTAEAGDRIVQTSTNAAGTLYKSVTGSNIIILKNITGTFNTTNTLYKNGTTLSVNPTLSPVSYSLTDPANNINSNLIEIQTAGNRSMLASDFTQINDLGYGIFVNNNAFFEAVSIFCYYNYRAFYALNGAQIRSLNGSCGYGVYALNAEGADPTEVPTPAVLAYPMVQVLETYSTGNLLNKKGALLVYVYVDTADSKQYKPFNVSELEVEHGFGTSTTTVQILQETVAPFTITLTSTASFGSSGVIRIDTEYFAFNANDTVTNTLSIYTRNLNSSGAALHNSGATVTEMKSISRYEISSATLTGATNGTKVGYVLNISTGGNNNKANGLDGDIPGGTKVIMRNLQNFEFLHLPTITPTRPSTALQFYGDSNIYHVLSYDAKTADNGAGDGDLAAIIAVSESYTYIQISPVITAGTGSGLSKVPGDVGDTTIRITQLDSVSSRLPKMIFAWGDTIHAITTYTKIDNDTATLEFTPALTKSVAASTYGGSSPTLKAGLPKDVTAELTVQISVMRATGHDLVDIGTGSYADSNIPANIYGGPANSKKQDQEVQEIGKGRVFYATTDQDGNVRFGKYFRVDQGTGTVTFSASIALSNLTGIGFKRGVTVAEFSTDDTMTNNATDTVPVQTAITGYINKRLGLTTTSQGVSSASPNAIGPGFIPRNGSLAATANIDLGTHKVINLADPTLSTDATTKNYVDTFFKREGGERRGIKTFRMGGADEHDTINRPTKLFTWSVARDSNGKSTIVVTNDTDDYPSSFVAVPHGLSIGSLFTIPALVINSSDHSFEVTNGVVTEVPNYYTFCYSQVGLPVVTETTVGAYINTTSNIDMNGGKITNLVYPTDNKDAANKQYVIDLVATKDQLSELNDVTLTNPLVNHVFMYNGTKWVNGAQTGDVTYAISGNTATSTIGTGKIDNSMVGASAAIAQSKLAMTAASTRANATAIAQSDLGLASFDSNFFTATSGWLTITDNAITLGKLATLATKSVIGNKKSGTLTPEAVSFQEVIEGALTTPSVIGVLTRTAANNFSSLAYASAGTASTLVYRDSSGNFTAGTISASLTGNADTATTLKTPRTIQGVSFDGSGGITVVTAGTGVTVTGTEVKIGQAVATDSDVQFASVRTTSLTAGNKDTSGTITGQWTLATGSILQSTYADLAEYYISDNTYEFGTVMMIGGTSEITIAKGQGTTAVAGVVSKNPAFIMNEACSGRKLPIALQGRVPCRVVGNINKGDLLVVSMVPGVAMASTDPKAGSIIGKALGSYSSSRVGLIEVLVGKH